MFPELFDPQLQMQKQASQTQKMFHNSLKALRPKPGPKQTPRESLGEDGSVRAPLGVGVKLPPTLWTTILLIRVGVQKIDLNLMM